MSRRSLTSAATVYLNINFSVILSAIVYRNLGARPFRGGAIGVPCVVVVRLM